MCMFGIAMVISLVTYPLFGVVAVPDEMAEKMQGETPPAVDYYVLHSENERY